jgi:O-antigen/teichoic acid export membrane protein
MSAINSLTDSVFLAYRQAKYSLIINFIFSFIKMLLPLFLAVWGAFGIFSSAALGQTIGFILSVGIIIWKFDYRPQFIISKDVLQEVWRYSAGNYIAMALNLLPVTVLPLIITNQLSSKESAYFYIVMMIGNLLYVIPLASSKSLFAEGSHDENSITKNIKKTIKTISVFLIPSMVALLIGGKFILGFFGKSYSHEGLGFLYLVALSAISVSIYSLISVIFKIKKLIRPLIVTNALYATGVIGCSYLFISYGLLGIGYAWLVGNSVAALSGWILYIYFYRPKTIASLS